MAAWMAACSSSDRGTTAPGKGGGPVRIALTSAVVANPGAVVEAMVAYTPSPGATPITLGRQSIEVNTGSADAALSLTVDVAPCVRDAALLNTNCVLALTLQLTRNGVVLDESTQSLTVTADTERLDATAAQLFEVASIRITPSPVTGFEPGDSVALTATPLDRQGSVVAARSPTWSVVSGGAAVSVTGMLRGLSTGAAVVRASVGGRTQDLTVDVKPLSVARLEVAPADTTIPIGSTFALRVTPRSAFNDALTDRVVSYTSSNPFIAAVSSIGGSVTAGSIGVATITARSTDGRNGSIITAQSTVRVEASPSIAVDPSAFAFDLEAGQPLPPATTALVRNAGGGSLGIMTSTTDALLFAALDRTTAPATLTIRPTTFATTSLPIGVPTASIVRIHSTTSGVPDALVTVTLTRRAPPQIVVDRSLVDFDGVVSGTSTPFTTVGITSPTRTLNGVFANIAYRESVSPWLSVFVSPSSTPSTLTLRAFAGTLPSGTYTADVTVAAVDASTPATVRVTMRVLATGNVRVSPKVISLGPVDPALIAGRTVPVAVTSSRSEFTLDGLSASTVYLGTGTNWLTTALDAIGSPTTLNITSRPTGLAEGTYQARVIVSSTTPGSNPDTVAVELTVQRDSILATPDLVALTLPASPTVVQLRARSGDTLQLDTPGYDITYDQPQYSGWLGSISFQSRLLPSSMSFTPSPVGLVAGNYSATITLKARNGTRVGTVRVTLAVTSGFGQITVGNSHTCALTGSLSTYCWGLNDLGQLANGASPSVSVPTPSAIGRTFAQIVAGAFFTCGRTSGGQVYCWGSNQYGQLGNGSNDPGGMQPNPSPTLVSGSVVFTDITLGYDFACGRASNGDGFCWGNNSSGQTGTGSFADRFVPTLVVGGHNFNQIVAGYQHACGITTFGTTYCWGTNASGQIGQGSITDENFSTPLLVSGNFNFVKLSAGGDGTCGRANTGVWYCWGGNQVGQLGLGTSSQVGVGAPAATAPGYNFVDITMGVLHGCGRTAFGTVFCWGDNEGYQLGIGMSSGTTTPTVVSGGFSWTSVMAGSFSTCGRATNGNVYCWGDNASGQLGNGSNSPGTTPQMVTIPGPFVQNAMRALPRASAPPPPMTRRRRPSR